MRLLFAIKSLNGVGGGAERVLVEVASGLAGRGHEVTVLTLDPQGEAFYGLSPDVMRIDEGLIEPGASLTLAPFLHAIPRIRRDVVAVQPDVVIAFMHTAFIPLYFILSGLSYPIVASEHTVAEHFKSRPIQRVLRRFVEKRVALRTVPSEQARQSFCREGEADRFVVGNPINLAQFPLTAVSQPNHPPIVLSVGNLRPEKDHAVLLDAFAQVASDFPEWRLRIVGDGVLRPNLEAQCEARGLDGRVEMPGFTRDVATEYAKARFVVLPSLYESFGLVAAEALASGRAVLSFDDCAGIKEIVTDGQNGILVPGVIDRSTRIQNLAVGLRRLMSDANLRARLGAAGPASVERFNISSVLDRWEEVIQMATAGSSRKTG